MDRLNVGLDAWIIRDGNYDDFKVGDEVSFALEYLFLEAKQEIPAKKKLDLICWSEYEFNAQVVFVAPEFTVIDCGVLAYSRNDEDHPKWEKGEWVAGEINLSVDPFHYRDQFSKVSGAPQLAKKYRITGIDLETTPWLSKPTAAGLTLETRDYTKKGYRPVDKTDAQGDDGGKARYILNCDVL